MTMEGRNVYWLTDAGIQTIRIELDGSFGKLEQLVTREQVHPKFKLDGLAVSDGIIVAWNGRNGITRYDTNTGELTTFDAVGDDLSGNNDQVYSKWVAVMSGVFIGITENEGFVIYRDSPASE